ncbi:hypothetical protein NDU88_004191 [Pleurodeles waltl]|uniref:MHC class I antigen n=1 Tax=Pleurodeles waltl TaxID=8319 RepID=A0AAV7T8M1_PLEWA|nr:hypothetical protein NDU88_004191 [Pleurodeles waltl]
MNPRLRAWSEGVGAVGFGGGWVFGEGEYQLGVVGIGDDVDAVFACDVGEGAYVDIEESRALRGALRDAADDLGGIRAERREVDSLGAVREKRGDPVQGLSLDTGGAEAGC